MPAKSSRSAAAKVYVLPGNHESADRLPECARATACTTSTDASIQVGQWHVAGLGYSNPTPFNTPGEYSEPQIAERLQRFAGLIPWCWSATRRPTARRSTGAAGLHAGSTAVREFIRRQQPAYFFCGHIHEAEGVEIGIGQTRA